MRPRYDIVIAGGGMVGISLALHLDYSLDGQLAIAVVEGAPLADGLEQGYHPSFDARSTALSFSSREICNRMGVWDDLSEWLCPIERIHVSSRGHFGSVLMHASDYQWPALGWVVENGWLGKVLMRLLRQRSNIELLNPQRVEHAGFGAVGAELKLSGGETLQTGLLVVADGARSRLRQQLGFQRSEKPYAEHALIANVATARGHDMLAFERFTDQGPLAFLPLLPVTQYPHRSALVWTLPAALAQQLKDCSEQEFLSRLQARFGYRLGKLIHVGDRFTYPLAMSLASEQVRRNVVVMGNAAHALHPVAGQGFNLALRDIAVLAEVLKQGITAGKEPGDLALLKRYQSRQMTDQRKTLAFSDLLPALFSHDDPMLTLARDLGLVGLDVFGGVKKQFVRHSAGVASMASAAVNNGS